MSESEAERREPEPTGGPPAGGAGNVEPDVVLDIPEVSVDSIRLAVDGLDADVSLRARLANLLQLDAGVRVHLEGVELDMTGVRAEALLKVHLEKLAEILDRALSTIDRNPEIIAALARTAEESIDDVNRAAGQLTGDTARKAGPPLGAIGAVADQTGQRVGEIGAVADETLRDRTAAAGSAPDRPEQPSAAPRPPQPPAHTGRGEPSGSTGRGEPQSAPSAGQGGEPGPGGERGPGGEPGPGEEAGQVRDTGPGGGPADQGQGRSDQGGAAAAAQLADQAGETLRQAGRSVWEAIQGTMAQHRQNPPSR
jgi:hypothetical protein